MMSPRCLRLFSILLLLSTFVTAWPWPRWLPELDTLIVQRDSNNDTSSSTSASSTPSGSQSTSQGTTSSASQSHSTSNSVTSHVETIVSGGHTFTTTLYSTITPAPSTTGSSSGSSGSSSSTTFAASLPAGAISLITPAVISGAQYYKVGSNVTFVFGYTDVLATPTAVDVLASGSASQQTYTMAMNHTVSNATGTVIWDTGEYQATALADPLLTQMYTLIIYDAASSISATAQPGYLAVYEQYTFGMYTPQPYTPLSNYTCATCSGALSEMERMALTTVLGVSIITILSFTWFVGGLAVTW